MGEPEWPIRLASKQLQEMLGAGAQVEELEDAFAALDQSGTLEAEVRDHRRTLLLRPCDYRVSKEWVLGPGH